MALAVWLIAIILLLDTLQTTSPLISKALLTWLTASFTFHQLTPADRAALAAAGQPIAQPRGIGYGIGLAIALFAMQGLSWNINQLGNFWLSNYIL